MADFSRALHTCLFMIPKRSNMGLSGPFEGNMIRASIEDQTDVAPHSGAMTAGCDSGNDLPDYEYFPLPTQFEQWAGPGNVTYLEDEEEYEPEEDGQSDGSQEDEEESICDPEGDEQSEGSDAEEEGSTYQPMSPTLSLDRRHEVNPWKNFLRENAMSILAPKRPFQDDHADSQSGIADLGERKRRCVK
ncbi:hypothetical protein OQA88_4472 [Cercophora sp. LCS_1]